MPATAFHRFHRYAEITERLHGLAAVHPQLATIESIGRGFEGRELWVVTLTNVATGPAAEKLALWVDRNSHATEVAGSAAALYFIDALRSHCDRDEEITRALDARTFYVCVRVSPDGIEWALAERPRWVRSSTRPCPVAEDLTMRPQHVASPNGRP